MRALIFAHYDRHGVLDPHVEFSLCKYREVFEHITLVSTSLVQLPATAARYVDEFIPRQNSGYDFGSWQKGLASHKNLERYREVFLLNDSVYGPLFDVRKTIEFGSSQALPAWGMVMSNQSIHSIAPVVEHHLQSWFVSLTIDTILQSDIQSFWNELGTYSRKSDIIEHCELELSRRLLRAGIRIGAVYDVRTQAKPSIVDLAPDFSFFDFCRSFRLFKRAFLRPYNPSELLWHQLWDAGVPYTKVSLFRLNPHGVRVDRVLAAIENETEYDVRLIRNHLARLAS